jgi:hypothetical protein
VHARTNAERKREAARLGSESIFRTRKHKIRINAASTGNRIRPDQLVDALNFVNPTEEQQIRDIAEMEHRPPKQ